MTVYGQLENRPPKLQADAVLNQANPVSGTKYTVLDTTKNVRIYSIWVKVTWSVDTSGLEIHLTIDDVVYRFFVDPTSAQNYFVRIVGNATADGQVLETTEHQKTWLIDGQSVKIEAESTGGTADPLEARVKYAKY